MYTVDYFIKKFEAIPEDSWCTGQFVDHFSGQRCAQGHCLMNYKNNEAIDDRLDAWCRLNFKVLHPDVDTEIYHFLELFESANINVADVNNGNHFCFTQPTPKQRILAALYDIKNLQDIDTGAKRERIVYVAVSETIKEQASELILS